MAEYVHSGDKIQASQYNALVDAIAGPTNATTDQPFTQTKNGIVINGGIGPQTTKAASTVPAMFEVSYGNGYVGAGYNTYQQGNIDANRFNGVFLNIGSWDTLTHNGFVLGNGVAVPTIPVLAIIDPTNTQPSVVPYGRALAETITTGKLPLCNADEDAGYAFVQIVDNGSAGKDLNGDFVLLVGDFTKIGGNSGSDIKTVARHQIRAAIRGINLYENCEDVRVVQGGVLWRHNVISGVVGSTIPHLSYTVGTQHVAMLPDAYVNRDEPDQLVSINALMDVKLKSIGIVPQQQMGFSGLNSTNTFELYNFDKLQSDIDSVGEIDKNELSSYDVLLKHKKPHPYAEDDPDYEGQAEADLQYIPLSAMLEVGDSQVSNLYLSSAEVQEYVGSDGRHRYVTLHGFGNDQSKQWADLSSKGDYIDVLVRDTDSKGPPAGIELKYVALTSILDGLTVSANVSVDSETTSLSSIQRDEDGVLQLFGFGGDDIKDYSSISADGDYDVILRNRGAGYRAVEYTSLSALAQNYTGDSQLTTVGKKSIQVKQTDAGQKYVQLYNFEVPRATGDAEVSLSCGEWKYIGKSSGSAPDPDFQFVVRDLGNNEIKYADVRVKLPMIDATKDVIHIENAISNYITNISSTIEGDLSSELSNYWKVDGTHDDNCHGHSIGDSTKSKVIDLDSKALVNGSVNSVNWGTCVLRDQNNNMAACWGNTANIGRTLRHSQGMATVNWESMQLQTRARGTTVDWEQRELRGAWKIVRGDGQYSQATLTIGSTTINETQLQQLLALINP